MENKFKLTNVVLYAKGWYLRTDDLFADLYKILELDDYTCYTNSDIYYIFLINVQECNHRWCELREVMIGIDPKNCWKVSYYYEEYDMKTAFIFYVLSNLRYIDSNQWDVQTPKVTKYPRGENITIQKLVQQFVKH